VALAIGGRAALTITAAIIGVLAMTIAAAIVPEQIAVLPGARSLRTLWSVRVVGGFRGWSGCGLEDFDGALGSGGSCEFLVAGEQGGVHGFGEGYVGRVVDGEVVP
jgi:hypothetical protein